MEKIKIFTGFAEDSQTVQEEINEFLNGKCFISLTPTQSTVNNMAVLTFTLIYKEKKKKLGTVTRPKGI